jgi:Acetyltransferase (GNAT) domain
MSSFQYILSSHSEDEKKASLNLMRESFGNDIDIAYHEYYEWQYLKNPLGSGNVLLAYDGKKPVGQIASVPCKYNFAAKKTHVSLTMNLGVSPPYRGKGIMGELLSRINKINQSMFWVAVPNEESMRGHLKLMEPMPLTLMIRPVRLSNYFSNPLVAGKFLKPFDLIWKKKKTTSKFQIQEHISMFDERFDDLFFATNGQKMIRQVRDSKFLNWRYRTNPRRKYTTFIATGNDGKIEGYIILRVMEIFGKRSGLIIDLLTRENSTSARSLIVMALDYFWTNRAALAMVTCFPNSNEYHLAKKEGFLVCPKRFLPHPLTLCLKASSEAQNITDKLADPNNWFFMFGDYETF